LDEPTTGVDAVSRKEFWEMLKQLKAQGITILVSTPYMDEADLCDRIALIQTGSILSIDTPAGIKNKFPHKLFAAKCPQIHKALNDLRASDNIGNCYAFGERLHFYFKNNAVDAMQSVNILLANKGLHNAEITKIEPTVEDCFIELMSGNEK
jgi:ABC-type multidrug transport system ATPase subunit